MMFGKRLFAVAGLSLSVAACGADTQIDADVAGDERSALVPAKLVAAVWDASAHEHTAAEIAKLALHRSKNEAVLTWAKASMATHQAAYDELRRLGDTLHLKISKIMTIEGEKQYEALFVRGSRAFDAPFKDTLNKLQSRGIEHAQTLHDATTDAQLRAWSDKSAALWKSEQDAMGALP